GADELAGRLDQGGLLAAHLGTDLPYAGQFRGMLGDVVAACVGEGVVRTLGAADQPFVDELRQGRVDRTRARTPRVVGLFGDRFDQAVAVVRRLGEQGQDGQSDVAAAGAATGTERAATGAESVAEAASEAGAACGERGRERWAHPTTAGCEAGAGRGLRGVVALHCGVSFRSGPRPVWRASVIYRNSSPTYSRADCLTSSAPRVLRRQRPAAHVSVGSVAPAGNFGPRPAPSWQAPDAWRDKS